MTRVFISVSECESEPESERESKGCLSITSTSTASLSTSTRFANGSPWTRVFSWKGPLRNESKCRRSGSLRHKLRAVSRSRSERPTGKIALSQKLASGTWHMGCAATRQRIGGDSPAAAQAQGGCDARKVTARGYFVRRSPAMRCIAANWGLHPRRAMARDFRRADGLQYGPAPPPVPRATARKRGCGSPAGSHAAGDETHDSSHTP
jgi:hypothetical protein